MLIDEKIELIDKIATHDPEYFQFLQWTLSAKYPADRYKISDEVVKQIALLYREKPHLLLHNFQFAVAPTPEPPKYVEWDAYRLVQVLTNDNSLIRKEDILNVDRYLGIMLKENIITTIVAGEDGKVYPHSVAYAVGELGEPYKYHKGLPPLAVLQMPEDQKLAFLLGTTYTHEQAFLTNDLIDWLLNNVEVLMPYTTVKKLKTSERIAQRLEDCSGEFRFMMAMLLWINQKHVTYFEKIPAFRKMMRGKPKAYVAHHIVKLQQKKNIIKAIWQSLTERAAPRLHDVRPTWRTRGGRQGCIHAFPMMPNENGHFICTLCEANRHRVKKHQRGDATKGCIVKEYVA